METEKDIENYLTQQVRKAGGICWKFTSPGTRGVPDRYCAVMGKSFFAELKRPNHKRRHDEMLQKERHKALASQGVKVYVLETKQDIDLLFRWLTHGLLPEVSHFGHL